MVSYKGLNTTVESKANKYTFVWRKTVERNCERLMKKIHVLLGQIDDVIAREKSSENNEEVEFTPAMLTEMAGELRHAMEQVSEPSAKEEKTELKKKRKQLKELGEHRDKLQEYDCHLETLQERKHLKLCLLLLFMVLGCFAITNVRTTTVSADDETSDIPGVIFEHFLGMNCYIFLKIIL